MTSATLPPNAGAARRLAFARGDAQRDARLREVVRVHYDALWRFLRRMGLPEGHVEDAAQQALLVFAARASSIDEKAERPFLFGTALKIASDYRRSAEHRREVVDAEALLDEPDPTPDPEHQLGRLELRAQLDRILDELSPDFRAVFVLAELEELTMTEISRLLNVPPGTVASRLRRARELVEEKAAALRETLEADTEAPHD